MQSAIHDPRANLTPSQQAAAMAQRMRRAKLAARAVNGDAPRKIVTFVIPNTPFGIPKTFLRKPVPPPFPTPRMWFEDLIDEAERQLAKRIGPRKVLIEDIQHECAKLYGVSREAILSPCRLKVIVKPRQVAMYLAKQMTERSLPDIGRRFGNRDHTTGLHAIRKMERLVGIDEALAAEINQIKAAIAMRVA